MQDREEAILLRVFIGERERFNHHPLYEAIVRAARDAKLAGATVLRGLMGYGHLGRIEYAKILDLSDDLPVVVEIVDTEERIEAFLPTLDTMISSGLVTLEKATVLRYGRTPPGRPRISLADAMEAQVRVDHGEASKRD
jgi:PII-like signaling protein